MILRRVVFLLVCTLGLLGVSTLGFQTGATATTAVAAPAAAIFPPLFDGPYLYGPYSYGPPAQGETPPGEGPWVVRAHYPDRAALQALASRMEPWEVDREAATVVVEATAADYAWLLANGFSVQVDWELTNRLLQPNLPLPGQTNGIPGYPCYRTVEETYQTAADLAAAYPDLVSWKNIGDSWEKITPGGSAGYDLNVLRLTNTAVQREKPVFFIMASIHAREYAPAELATRFAEHLVAQYGIDADVTWLLDYHEIHLLLQSNPDGRKQAEGGLSWRKNTNENYCSPTSIYRGVDLNRNFSFMWGCCAGSSNQECSLVFRGHDPASEPETQAIQNYVRSIFPDARPDDVSIPAPADTPGIFLDLHSYSELVLWPWGFEDITAPNGQALQTLGRRLAYFNSYTPDQAIGLYPTDGTTTDFAYGELGIAAYTFEVGTSFFQDCATFENTIWPVNRNAMLYAAKTARAPYQTPAGPEALNLSVLPAPAPGGPYALSAVLDDTRVNQSNGLESTQNIAAAVYTIDLPPWDPAAVVYPLAAADGAFNEKTELVAGSINVAGLTPTRHTVYVRGRDAANNWGPVSAKFFTVTPSAPTAAFSAPSPVYLDQPAPFTNQSTGSLPLTFAWDFGDGVGTSTEKNPTYTYTATGVYTVTLTAANAYGESTVAHPIQVVPCIPFTTLDFSQISADPLIIGRAVQVSLNPGPDEASFPYQYTLDWGDATAYQQGAAFSDPLQLAHVFSQPGVYTATASLTNGCMPTPLSATISLAVEAPLGVALWPPASLVWGLPGETVTHTLRLTNTGTLPDAFSIQLAGGEWEAQAPAATPTLAPAQSVELPVRVTIPPVGTAGEQDILALTATSTGDPAKAAYASLTTGVATAYGLALRAGQAQQAALPGAVVTYTVSLTNTGSIADVYTLTLGLSGPANAWETRLFTESSELSSGDSLALAAGGGQTLTISVTIPFEAGDGELQNVQLIITSQGSPELSLTQDLTCRAVYHRRYFPVLLQGAAPGR